jgi:hypothetical protein
VSRDAQNRPVSLCEPHRVSVRALRQGIPMPETGGQFGRNRAPQRPEIAGNAMMARLSPGDSAVSQDAEKSSEVGGLAGGGGSRARTGLRVRFPALREICRENLRWRYALKRYQSLNRLKCANRTGHNDCQSGKVNHKVKRIVLSVQIIDIVHAKCGGRTEFGGMNVL